MAWRPPPPDPYGPPPPPPGPGYGPPPPPPGYYPPPPGPPGHLHRGPAHHHLSRSIVACYDADGRTGVRVNELVIREKR
ncbi:hypothetical protein Ancab_006355 [Ancistrocladus abbreviatus]